MAIVYDATDVSAVPSLFVCTERRRYARTYEGEGKKTEHNLFIEVAMDGASRLRYSP